MKQINRLNLWIIFGIAWFIPQVILKYLPEQIHWIKIPILIISGVIIIFEKGVDNFLLKDKPKKEKKK